MNLTFARLLLCAVFVTLCGGVYFAAAAPTLKATRLSDTFVSAAQSFSQDPVLEDSPIHAGFAKAAYYPVSSQKLLLLNNPECLTIDDLADTNTGGQNVIYDNLQLSGRFRLFYAHKNCFAATANPTVHYAVALTNNQASPISITYYSPGLSTERDGGVAWTRHFAQYENLPKVEVIQPGATFYLVRTDVGDGSGSAGEGLSLSGVCDFEVTNGTVRLRAFAFRIFDNIDFNQLVMNDIDSYPNILYSFECHTISFSRLYISAILFVQITYCNTLLHQKAMSFSTRNSRDVDESKNYKGISPSTQVLMTNLNIDITEIDSGAIQVEYPTYNLENNAYSKPQKSSRLITNASPITDSESVLSDIQNVLYIEEQIDPKKTFSISRSYPALNNLGVIYSISGYISNRESKAQTVSFTMTTPDAAIVVYAQEGQPWTPITTTAGTPLEYFAVTVDAGATVQFQLNYVLGYPDTSKITHQFFLCCGDESDDEESDITGGSIFLIIFFVGGTVYLAGGLAYNYLKNGLRGVEAIPNIAFWRICIQYVKDGWKYTVGLVTCQRHAAAPAASESTPTRPATATYDTFAGDYGTHDPSSAENPFRHHSATE